MPDLTTVGAALLLAAIPSLVYVLLLRAIDRYEPDPWRVLLSALILGAVIVPLAAMAVRVALGQPFSLPLPYGSGGPQPVVRIAEQLIAGGVLLGFIYAFRDEFSDALDAVVYGAAIGAGLGAAHTFLFAYDGTGLLNVGSLAVLAISGLNQAFYGAAFGAFVGYALWYLPKERRIAVIVLGLATAALLSALHDALPYMLSRLVNTPDAATGVVTRLIAFSLNVLGLIAIAVVVVHFWGHEASVLRKYLHSEVGRGTITEHDYQTLTSARMRLARQWDLLRQGRFEDVAALRAMYVAEGKLAFDNWHREQLNRSGEAADTRTERLRERVRNLAADVESRHI